MSWQIKIQKLAFGTTDRESRLIFNVHHVTCLQFLSIDRARALRYLQKLKTMRIKLDLYWGLTEVDRLEKCVLIDR